MAVVRASKPTKRQWAIALTTFLTPLLLLLAGPPLLRHFAMGEAQRQALVLMEVPPPPARGDNAFLWLATASHEVPEDELQAAIDQDNEHYKAYLVELSKARPEPFAVKPYDPLVRTGYPARRRLKLGSEACYFGGFNNRCLAAVLANPTATRYLIKVESGRLEVARRILASGHITNTYPDDPPFQTWDPLALALTAAALEAAEGRVPEAMQQACGLMAWARDQSVNTTNFYLRGQVWAVREGAGNLLLDLRRTFPAVPVSPACREAMAPAMAREFDVCETARADFRHQQQSLSMPPNQSNRVVRLKSGLKNHLVSDRRVGQAWMAQRHAPYCSNAAREALAKGSDFTVPAPATPTLLQCAAALSECQAMHMPYAFRSVLAHRWHEVTNAQARQQLLDAAQAHLDAGGTGPAPEIPGYEVRADPDGDALTLMLRYPDAGTSERRLELGMADTAARSD